MRFTMIAVAMLGLTVPAFAQTDVAAPVPGPTPKPEKQLCRTQDATVGTRLGAARICHTKAEWAEIDKANDRQVRDLDR